MTSARLAETVLALRREFDSAFASEPAAAAAELEDLLAVRVGSDPYALRLDDVAEIHAQKKIVPLPSLVPQLLGMAGFRNLIAPVYDIGALLGYARSNGARWLVLTRGPEPIGLAFESFEGHVRLPRAEVVPDASDAGNRKHVRGVIRWDGTRPIIDLASLLSSIKKES